LRAAADGDHPQPRIKPRAIEVPAVAVGVAQEIALDRLVAGLLANLTVMICRDAVGMRDGRGRHLIGGI
jgi:hypothetical protein